MQISSAYKQRLANVGRIAASTALVVSSVGTALVQPTFAAQLNSNQTLISDSRLQSGGGTGVDYTVAFAPPSGSTTVIKEVQIQFCTQAGSWTDTCTAPGTFDIAASPTTAVTNFGVTGGPNTLGTASRTASNGVKVTISGSATGETTAIHTIKFTGAMTNPNVAATYYTRVRTFSDSPGTIAIDDGESAFAVIQKTTVSGRVLESMTFTVGSVANGVACGTYENSTVSSDVNSVPFGNFQTGTPRIGCQTVATATNAVTGYTTTLREVNGGSTPVGGMCRQTATNCNAEGGQTSVSANDVITDTVLNATPATWSNGTTYGLGFGVSGTQKDGTQFTADNQYRSIFGATPIKVSSTGAPTTAASSLVYVVYKADVSPTQTAGLYQNALEYVSTPTF